MQKRWSKLQMAFPRDHSPIGMAYLPPYYSVKNDINQKKKFQTIGTGSVVGSGPQNLQEQIRNARSIYDKKL